jgi:hypothetical protein
MTQFWLTVSQLETSRRVMSTEKVALAPGAMSRTFSKPRSTTLGSLGPPRET